MNDLIHSCASALDQAVTPSCGTDYGERVTTIILSKTKVSTSANVPSASDFTLAYNQLAIFKYVVNGHRIKLGETVIQWNMSEYYDPMYRVEGRIKRISETMARSVEKISRYKNLYLYYITENNYCHGPYWATPHFNIIELEGKGAPPYLKFRFDFIGNGIDYAAKDTYDNIYNPSVTDAILTEDGFDIWTEDGQAIIQE